MGHGRPGGAKPSGSSDSSDSSAPTDVAPASEQRNESHELAAADDRSSAEAQPSAELIQPLEDDSVVASIATVIRQQISFTGPQPHPSVARAYEELCPGWLDRDTAMRERALELRGQALERRDQRLARGQLFALLTVVLTLAAGTVFVVFGHPAAGATIVTATLVSVVGAFLYRERASRKSRPRRRSTDGSSEPADESHDSRDSQE